MYLEQQLRKMADNALHYPVPSTHEMNLVRRVERAMSLTNSGSALVLSPMTLHIAQAIEAIEDADLRRDECHFLINRTVFENYLKAIRVYVDFVGEYRER